MFLVFGVLAAGCCRARTDRQGQVVDAAMVDGSASLMALSHALMNTAGSWARGTGSNLLDTRRAVLMRSTENKDDQYSPVGAIEAHFYEELLLHGHSASRQCKCLVQFRARIVARVPRRYSRPKFREKTRDEWTEIFRGRRRLREPVLTPREAARHRYNVGSQRVLARRRHSTQGRGGAAPRFSKTPVRSGDPRERPARGRVRDYCDGSRSDTPRGTSRRRRVRLDMVTTGQVKVRVIREPSDGTTMNLPEIVDASLAAHNHVVGTCHFKGLQHAGHGTGREHNGFARANFG